MKNIIQYFLATLAAFAAVAIFASYKTTPGSGQQSPDEYSENRMFYIPTVGPTDEYWFAGERIPTENFDVRERLERELIVNTYYHTATILNLKKMTRYFPVIEPILKEHGIPDDFKYLAVAESNLANGTSTAGAKGFWQFMKSAASDFNLEVTDEVDERNHLEKTTQAACKYLKKYRQRLGSWVSTAAAYNMGPTGFENEIAKQGFDNYFEMNLNEETSRYVFRIIAIREILEKPEKYGYKIPETEKYPPLDKFALVTVSEPIPNLGEFAKQHGTTYRLLKLYNPWLTSHKLTNPKKKTYEIKIPKG